ncbi:MAG: LemA family protein [Muribaculaceae bacterium]|nr:LemA family protein [Muribaculaceae bacterium]
MITSIGSIIVISVVLLMVAAIFYSLYVSLIRKKNNVKEAMGGIDVQLNKRYDLIPNILVIANKFMEHERGLLEEITKLRSQAAGLRSNQDTISEKINLDNAIASKMGQLMVNVENYPQLKSDQTMIQAMQTYSEVEEHIAAARRFYNSAVKDLNNAVEIFPSSLIAALLGISQCPFFEAPEVARQRVNAADYMYKN